MCPQRGVNVLHIRRPFHQVLSQRARIPLMRDGRSPCVSCLCTFCCGCDFPQLALSVPFLVTSQVILTHIPGR